jgi:hypothetical protein
MYSGDQRDVTFAVGEPDREGHAEHSISLGYRLRPAVLEQTWRCDPQVECTIHSGKSALNQGYGGRQTAAGQRVGEVG